MTREGRAGTPPVVPHRLTAMVGRDPAQSHRGATPLELLFDLTFVASFGLAADAAAHLLAEGAGAAAVAGFCFASLAICWAWINYAWFASGFDNDDWGFRLTTMLQMVGVVVLALGIRPIFDSLERGGPVDNRVLVGGYVVMRVAMVVQWLRAARQDPAHRSTAITFVITITVAQLGWVLLAVSGVRDAAVFVVAVVCLYGIEMGGPVIAKRSGTGAPWHPHHIAERHGLLFIITIGEGVMGTITAVSALVEDVGWSLEAVLVTVAGTGLAFALWWSYFIVPFGEFLSRYRARTWGYGYGHIVIFTSAAGTGVGLHVAAYVVQGHAEIGIVGAVLATAIPVAVFTVAYFAIYSVMVRAIDTFHLQLGACSLTMLAIAVGLAAAGAPLGWCLIAVMAGPCVIVVGYETGGHRHVANDVLGVPNTARRRSSTRED